MLPRVLEPEVMETPDEADDYDRMAHGVVNRCFVADLLAAWSSLQPVGPIRVFDAGTGTAHIPILLAEALPTCSIVAADAAKEMLRLGERNVSRAGLSARISLVQRDCKALPEANEAFDVVMSNSLIHHLTDATGMFQECWRILKPGGLLFMRDLYRPPTTAEVERLVAMHAGEDSPAQQQLLRQSFYAALTVEEVTAVLATAGILTSQVRMTSDRHWTVIASKPPAAAD